METQLNRIVETFETEVTEEGYTQFSDHLTRAAERCSDNPAAAKILKMIRATGQYLGVEAPDTRNHVLTVLATLSRGLDTIEQDPEMKEKSSEQTLSECLSAYTGLTEKIGTCPLISQTEMERLKEMILSIDWEISIETLKRFDRMTHTLMTRLRFHKILYPFLKIINTMGRYIAAKKASAHKDAVSFLQSVFQDFEQVALNPYMPFQEKKRLIEKDIAAFNAFKKRITAAPPSLSFPEPSATASEEEIRPALSHIKAPQTRHDHKLIPLERVPAFSDGARPAAAANSAEGGQGQVIPLPGLERRDVMGELFSPKESEADKLMDRIHMSLVSGKEQTPATPSAPSDDPEGFQNFVPQRMDTDPIPEIRSRLDEFFDLDVSVVESPMDIPLFEKEEEEEEPAQLILFEENELSGDDPSGEEFLRPVSPGYGSPGADSPDSPLPDAGTLGTGAPVERLELFDEGEDPVEAAIERLKAFTKTTEPHPETLQEVRDDLALLRSLWQDDPAKGLLLDLAGKLADMADIPQDMKNLPPEEESDDSRDSGTPDMDTLPEAVTGEMEIRPKQETEPEDEAREEAAPPRKRWFRLGTLFRKRTK